MRKGRVLLMKCLSSSFLSPQTLVSLVLAILSSTQLLGCLTHKSNLDQVIQRLNVDCQDLDRPSLGLTNGDLLSLYEHELSEIKQLFRSAHPNSRGNRTFKNRFYAEHIHADNHKTLSSIRELHAPLRDHAGVAAEVLKQAQEHPVAATAHISDFKDGNQIGFCFARAFLIHYLLNKEGVSPCDIYKIFAFGEMRVDHKMWHFHVAVVVRSMNGPIVVDPFFEQPIPLHEWTREMEKLDIKFPYTRTRFYITDARKLLPASGVYALEEFMNPLLAPYFEALSATIGP